MQHIVTAPLRRLSPTLDRLLRGRRFTDLHAVLREGLRISVERYGLKEMELLHARAEPRPAGCRNRTAGPRTSETVAAR